jgi:hypothetical protein
MHANVAATFKALLKIRPVMNPHSISCEPTHHTNTNTYMNLVCEAWEPDSFMLAPPSSTQRGARRCGPAAVKSDLNITRTLAVTTGSGSRQQGQVGRTLFEVVCDSHGRQHSKPNRA